MAASTMAASTMAASTMAASTAGPAVTKILYDLKHHKAIIVRTDGCYEYHMNHQDLEMAKDDNLKHLLEQKMTDALNAATAIHEMGHHHIDHMSSEITTACASVPVYAFH
ncbi:hypothetical protein KUTeg_011854 [Tegillarca granosa]|uniref:Uncharacterized protein n=1 Tax=Tegillarca granosa TaxID=220873 RepID=A0ABQ9EY35_TEGGR|nr:hypothetical protein KUTeg_011854 [Tegillarca granosa]